MRRRRVLAAADVAAFTTAIGALAVTDSSLLDHRVLISLLCLPIWLLLAKLHGLYDHDHRELRHLTVDELGAIVSWVTIGVAITTLVLAVAPGESWSVASTGRLWLVTLALTPVWRASARFMWRTVMPPERLLIVGSGSLEQAARRKLELYRDIHARVVALADGDELANADPDDLLAVVRQAHDPPVDRIILASTSIHEKLIGHLLELCRREWIKLSVVPPASGMLGTAVRLAWVADLPMIEYSTWNVSRSTMALKRAIDVAVSAAGIVVIAVPSLLIAIAIKLDSRGPVMFVQRRAGLGGWPFAMVKFRTMTADAEDRLAELIELDKLREPMFKLFGDPRVTRVGHILRRTSLDELPQLINVLRGEMSLVGPRPEQVEVVDRYAPEHRFRLDLRPGMTGPMQVYGRGRLRFEERLAVEREYIENLSLSRDLKIALMTVVAVLRGEGAS